MLTVPGPEAIALVALAVSDRADTFAGDLAAHVWPEQVYDLIVFKCNRLPARVNVFLHGLTRGLVAALAGLWIGDFRKATMRLVIPTGMDINNPLYGLGVTAEDQALAGSLGLSFQAVALGQIATIGGFDHFFCDFFNAL